MTFSCTWLAGARLANYGVRLMRAIKKPVSARGCEHVYRRKPTRFTQESFVLHAGLSLFAHGPWRSVYWRRAVPRASAHVFVMRFVFLARTELIPHMANNINCCLGSGGGFARGTSDCPGVSHPLVLRSEKAYSTRYMYTVLAFGVQGTRVSWWAKA